MARRPLVLIAGLVLLMAAWELRSFLGENARGSTPDTGAVSTGESTGPARLEPARLVEAGGVQRESVASAPPREHEPGTSEAKSSDDENAATLVVTVMDKTSGS